MTALLALTTLLADTDFGHMGNWGAGWWILMTIGMVAFWGLVILGIVWVVRELAGGRGHARASESALDILDRRLAAGEITPEEYRERYATLTRPGETTR